MSQEFPGFFPSGAKLEVFADLFNVGNLLNKKWGVLEQYDFYRGVPVVDVSCVAATTTAAVPCQTAGARYLFRGTGANGAWQRPVSPFVQPQASLWKLRLGARFKF